MNVLVKQIFDLCCRRDGQEEEGEVSVVCPLGSIERARALLQEFAPAIATPTQNLFQSYTTVSYT